MTTGSRRTRAFVAQSLRFGWQSLGCRVLTWFVSALRSLLLAAHSAFGSLGTPELNAASLTLASLDHVMVLEEGGLNQVVMKAGMGWNQTLSDKHWRW